MAYLAQSTHYTNWLFTQDELTTIHKLRQHKVKKDYTERMHTGSSRHVFSFACLLPKTSTASVDPNDWRDRLEIDPQEEAKVSNEIEFLSLEEELMLGEFYLEKVQESCTQLFRTSEKVKGAAVMLYKRFYLLLD